GDLQDHEEISDAQTRVTIDEVQDAVMRAAKTVFREDGIGLAGEVAVGEKQELDEGDELGIGGGQGGRRGQQSRLLLTTRLARTLELRIYVSHVDLFDPDC